MRTNFFCKGNYSYLNFCHFLHPAFSTLRVFYAPPFLHSAFSTLRIFYTPYFPHSAFSTLWTPSSTLRVFYRPIADGPLNSRMFKTNCLVTTAFPLRQFCRFIRWLDIQETENISSQSISWSRWTCVKTQCLSIQIENIVKWNFMFYWESFTLQPEKFGKRSVISTVRPTVHINPSQKRSFSKTLFKPEEIENAGFSFSLGRKTFWKRSISDNDVVLVTIVIMIWFPWPIEFYSSAHISKMTRDFCGFKFPRRSVNGRHLMRARVKAPFLNSSGVIWTLNFRDIVVTLSPVNWVKRCS